MRICVVDDEQDMGFLFEQKFRKELKTGSIKFSFAHSGGECAKLLENITKDDNDIIVLVDVNLPDIDGGDLIKSLRVHYPKIKIIAFSGMSNDATATRCINNGADTFIGKPIDFKLLKNIIGV